MCVAFVSYRHEDKGICVNQLKSFVTELRVCCVALNRHLHHWELMMRIYARK
jgi:hypothetical protein